MDDFFTPELLVYLAGGTFILGYLIINQIILRLMVLLGTAFYIAYYATATDVPLWSAIYLSIGQGIATAIGLAALFARRSTWAIPTAHRDLYPRFDQLPPGDFRKLMRLGARYVVEDKEVLGTEGQPVDRLVYIVHGEGHVIKRKDAFTVPSGIFIGEVAYLLNEAGAATTWVMPGTEIISWNKRDLDRARSRDPRFGLALEAALSRDMAFKVACAVAPEDMRVSGPQAFDSPAAAT